MFERNPNHHGYTHRDACQTDHPLNPHKHLSADRMRGEKGEADQHAHHEHPENGPDPEQQDEGQRLPHAVDRGEDDQEQPRRPGEPVDHSDDTGLQDARHPVSVLVVPSLDMGMEMNVSMGSVIMGMQMPLVSEKSLDERRSENDEHYPHAEFEGVGEPGGDGDLEEEEQDGKEEENHRMPEPPE